MNGFTNRTQDSTPDVNPSLRPLDINCDLGEGEGVENTRALMALVDSANIACGGHAGDDLTMGECLRLAVAYRVRAGAHPGFPSRTDFGRRVHGVTRPTELIDLLDTQVGRLATIAREHGVRLHHVKLHGALYHQVDQEPELGHAYLAHVAHAWPTLAVVSRAGGGLQRLAGPSDPVVLGEAFLDRGYRSDGSLVPRGEAGAVLHDPEGAFDRFRSLRELGGWTSVDGTWIRLEPDTLCLHGDSPAAISMLTRLRGTYPRRTGFRSPGGSPGNSRGQARHERSPG